MIFGKLSEVTIPPNSQQRKKAQLVMSGLFRVSNLIYAPTPVYIIRHFAYNDFFDSEPTPKTKTTTRERQWTSQRQINFIKKEDILQRAWNIHFNTRLKGGDFMAIVQIGDFGEKDGVRTFSIQGDKGDLNKILDECREADAKFDDTPNMVHVRRGTWSMLLKVKVAVEVGGEG